MDHAVYPLNGAIMRTAIPAAPQNHSCFSKRFLSHTLVKRIAEYDFDARHLLMHLIKSLSHSQSA